MKIWVIGILVLFGICNLEFGILTCWAAQDIGALPVQVNGDQVQYFDAEKKMVAEGNVVVTYKDIRMTCKKATAFLDSKEAIAEGDVVITRGTDILRGEKIVYNFASETGTVINGVAQTDVWYGGGKELTKTSANEIDIRDGYLTTCDLAKPHYSIRSREVKIYLGKRVVAKNVTFNVGGVPVLFLPVYSQPLKERHPKVNIVFGHEKAWGTYVLSSYRYYLTDDIKGNLHLDYRQLKGFGEGIDNSFKTSNIGSGYVRTYYTDERDKVGHTETERWRTQYRHQWQIRPDTLGIVEFNKFSDHDFIKDYFYREEFEIDPQPRSYVYLLNTQSSFSASVFAQERVNRFFTEVERLPDAALNIRNQQLFGGLPLFYKADLDAVNLNRKTALSDQDNNAIRADTYNQLSLPLRLVDFISVDPYAAVRQTWYAREEEADTDRFRGIFYTGVDVSTNFYKTYGYTTNAYHLDINGMRHILTPNVSYFYVQKPTLLPDKLFPFDNIDTLDKNRGVGLFLENKLQTKHTSGGDFATAELLRFIVGTDYLFDLPDGHRFANVSSDLEVRPYSWFFMKQSALYDPKGRDLLLLNTDLVATDPKDRWHVGAGHRYERNASSQLTTQLETRVTPAWKVGVFEVYEFDGNKFKEQQYSITRDLHCWEAEFTCSVRNGYSFWFIMRLKAFPELPLKLGTSYYRPRSGATPPGE